MKIVEESGENNYKCCGFIHFSETERKKPNHFQKNDAVFILGTHGHTV